MSLEKDIEKARKLLIAKLLNMPPIKFKYPRDGLSRDGEVRYGYIHYVIPKPHNYSYEILAYNLLGISLDEEKHKVNVYMEKHGEIEAYLFSSDEKIIVMAIYPVADVDGFIYIRLGILHMSNIYNPWTLIPHASMITLANTFVEKPLSKKYLEMLRRFLYTVGNIRTRFIYRRISNMDELDTLINNIAVLYKAGLLIDKPKIEKSGDKQLHFGVSINDGRLDIRFMTI